MELCFEGFGVFNEIVNGVQLSSLCKDVNLENLVVQTTYKMVFNVDAGSDP